MQWALQVCITGWSQAALFRANSCRRVSLKRQQRTVVLVRECREHSTTHKAFSEVSCLKLGKYIPQSCLNLDNVIKSLSL
jgi:hypothetical protein